MSAPAHAHTAPTHSALVKLEEHDTKNWSKATYQMWLRQLGMNASIPKAVPKRVLHAFLFSLRDTARRERGNQDDTDMTAAPSQQQHIANNNLFAMGDVNFAPSMGQSSMPPASSSSSSSSSSRPSGMPNLETS